MAVKITGKPSFAVSGYLSILYAYKRAEDDRTVDLTWFYPGKSRDYQQRFSKLLYLALCNYVSFVSKLVLPHVVRLFKGYMPKPCHFRINTNPQDWRIRAVETSKYNRLVF